MSAAYTPNTTINKEERKSVRAKAYLICVTRTDSVPLFIV